MPNASKYLLHQRSERIDELTGVIDSLRSANHGSLIPCNQQKLSLLSDKNSLFR